jgi:hypothetical protein
MDVEKAFGSLSEFFFKTIFALKKKHMKSNAW